MFSRWMRWAIAIAAACAMPARAEAGSRPYAFVEGTESLPQGQVELENWFGLVKPRPSDQGSTVDWWIGPVVGITDQIEAALYAILVQPPEGSDTGHAIGLGALRFRASALLADPGAWPVDLKLRLEYEQTIGSGYDGRSDKSVWAEILASKDVGPINLTATAGGVIAFEKDGPSGYVRYGAAASFEALQRFRIGLEYFGEDRIDDKILENYLGPALAVGIGRVWVSSTLGVGIGDESTRVRGRIVVGVLL